MNSRHSTGFAPDEALSGLWAEHFLDDTASGDASLIQQLVAPTRNVVSSQGLAYLASGRFELAIEEIHRALQDQPNDPDLLAQLGLCLFQTDRLELALQAYRLARRLAPRRLDVICGMGNCYEAQGRFELAQDAYEMALIIEPDHIESLYNLMLSGAYAPGHPYAVRLQQLHGQCQDARRILICFALAHLYESHGEQARAFAYYEEGNALAAIHHPYDEAAAFRYLDRIESTYDAALFNRLGHIGNPDISPIFVVGMPRSGTSLIEQILASHPDVFGAGEMNAMPDIAHRLMPAITGGVGLQGLTPAMLPLLADHYQRVLGSHNHEGRIHVVDKLPSNYLHIGLIKLLFPSARIIHCVREPMDTCWSRFRRYFGGNHPYGHNQQTLGRYHRRYEQLMAHWHRMFPGQIIDVSYEQLVASPELAIFALLTMCGLSRDAACLDFHKTKRTVRTASMHQVRQPIYRSALASWKPMEEKLMPMRCALED